MKLSLSRYCVVDAINLWLETGGPFLVGGKVIDGSELTATDIEWVKGDVQVEVKTKETKPRPTC